MTANYRCVDFYDLCRICSDSAEHKLDIFSFEGRRKNIHAKIMECLSVNVEEKDRLPKKLCNQCLQRLESFYEFRMVCKNTQAMLNSCLNTAILQNGGKVYIKEATTNGNRSANVPQMTGLTMQGSQGQTQNAHLTLNPNDLINTIMQAVNVQQPENTVSDKPVVHQYTITVDPKSTKGGHTLEYKIENVEPAAAPQLPPQQHQQSTEKDSKHALEEFLKMKPNIKVTPIKRKDAQNPQQRPPLSPQQQLQARDPPSLPQQQPQQAQQQQQITPFQLQQLQQQLTQQWQQQQLQQQLQQFTSQLQPQQITITAPASAACSEGLSPSKAKKPKLNFVLSSPTNPTLSATLPQLSGSHQPQIQLQIQPTMSQQQQNATAQLLSNLAPLLQPHGQPQSHSDRATPGTMMSPNKCFLPITIKDENSDQQIVAHIDAKNFVFPTTYQLQMKLQPQLATADGQPIMQLTPTSIPATIQLTPQALSSTTFQAAPTAGNTLQQQILQPAPQTVQVTSSQIIKHANTANNNNHFATNDAATSTHEPHESVSINYKQQQQSLVSSINKQTKYKITQQAGSNSIEITPTTNFTQQIMQQVQQQQQQKQNKQQQQAAQNSGITMQRLNTKATITKLPANATTAPTTKLPVLNKNNVTISRITPQQQQQKAMPPPPVNQLKTAPKVSSQKPKPIQQQQATATTTPTSTSTASAVQEQNLHQLVQQKLIAHKKFVIDKTNKLASPPQQVKPTAPPSSATSAAAETDVSATDTPAMAPSSEEDVKPRTVVAPYGVGPNGLECPTCFRAFKKKEHLVQHVKLHAGLRPFVCTEEGCAKKFSRKEHLLRHQVSHSGRKMFSCDVCQKPFSRKDNLNKHRRIHTGQPNSSNYTCEICQKTFAVKAYYQQHRLIHAKQEPAGTATKDEKNNRNTDSPSAKPQNEPPKQQPQQSQQPQAQQIQILQQRQIVAPQQTPPQSQQQQQPQQQQIMHLQLPTVVTTQDLAGNTITITQSSEPINTHSLKNLGPHDSTMLNLADYMQLGQAQFVNPATGQIMGHIKIEK